MNERLQYKLLQYEEKPSVKVWEAISESLEDNTSFSDRLFNYEERPSPSLWNKIEPALENDNEAKLFPFTKKYKKTLTYIAAAAILGIIAITSTLLLNNKGVADELANTPVPTSNTPQQNIVNTIPDSNTSNSKSISSDSKKNETSPTVKNTRAEKSNTLNRNNRLALTGSRYLTMEDDHGKEVRLSKKAYSVFNCAENSMAAKRKNCIESIKSMQEKMATNIASPSADFAGLLEIIKSLEENN